MSTIDLTTLEPSRAEPSGAERSQPEAPAPIAHQTVREFLGMNEAMTSARTAAANQDRGTMDRGSLTE